MQLIGQFKQDLPWANLLLVCLYPILTGARRTTMWEGSEKCQLYRLEKFRRAGIEYCKVCTHKCFFLLNILILKYNPFYVHLFGISAGLVANMSSSSSICRHCANWCKLILLSRAEHVKPAQLVESVVLLHHMHHLLHVALVVLAETGCFHHP